MTKMTCLDPGRTTSIQQGMGWESYTHRTVNSCSFTLPLLSGYWDFFFSQKLILRKFLSSTLMGKYLSIIVTHPKRACIFCMLIKNPHSGEVLGWKDRSTPLFMYVDKASSLLCWCRGFAGLCAVGGRTISDKSRSPEQWGITSCQQKALQLLEHKIRKRDGWGRRFLLDLTSSWSCNPRSFRCFRTSWECGLEVVESTIVPPTVRAEHSSFY